MIMQTSEKIDKIAPAFLKAQKEFEAATKSSNNPFHKSKYADLTECLDASLPHLHANGITVLQPVSSGTETANIETILLHESGQFFCDSFAFKPDSNIQKLGSQITYLRRYCIKAILGLGEEDDDGNSAANKKPQQNQKPQQKQQQYQKPEAPPIKEPIQVIQECHQWLREKYNLNDTQLDRILETPVTQYGRVDVMSLQGICARLKKGRMTEDDLYLEMEKNASKRSARHV